MLDRQRLNRAREIWGENTRLPSPPFSQGPVRNTIWTPEESQDQPNEGPEPGQDAGN